MKKLLLVLFLTPNLGMALPPCPKDDVLIACKGIKENPERTINPSKVDRWEDRADGEWNVYIGGFNKNGQFHGKGTLIFEVNTWGSTQFYEGEWKDGKKHGYGLYKYYDGTIYEGEWKDGQHHGQGKINYGGAGDWGYIGGWKDGKKHGQGTYDDVGCSTYTGEWKDGKKHGYGVETLHYTGERYEGEFINGKITGSGKITDTKDEEKKSRLLRLYESHGPHVSGTLAPIRYITPIVISKEYLQDIEESELDEEAKQKLREEVRPFSIWEKDFARQTFIPEECLGFNYP